MACESLRVEQVDANFLDCEYKQIIEQQFTELTIGLPVSISRICDYFKPEIRLLVDSVLWTTRVYRGASPGQLQINIAYKDYPLRKVFTHFIISVFIPYVHGRLFSAVSSGVIRKFLSKLAAVYEAFCILHYLNFLRVGGHSTLVESYLILRNWNNDLPTVGTINYESQNRELLWHTFRDALLLLWPFYTLFYEKYGSRSKGEVQSNEEALSCGKCGQTAVAPMRTKGCAHIACYWCVASRGPAERKRCVVCGAEAETVPLRGRALV